jgi:hypothetical protein
VGSFRNLTDSEVMGEHPVEPAMCPWQQDIIPRNWKMKATSERVFFTVFQSQITLYSLEKFSA